MGIKLKRLKNYRLDLLKNWVNVGYFHFQNIQKTQEKFCEYQQNKEINIRKNHSFSFVHDYRQILLMHP